MQETAALTSQAGTRIDTRRPYLHVIAAVAVRGCPSFSLAGRVAVTVAREVGPRQVAVPKVVSFALLIFTFVGSETDQVTFTRVDIGAAHPGEASANAENFREFPGGAA